MEEPKDKKEQIYTRYASVGFQVIRPFIGPPIGDLSTNTTARHSFSSSSKPSSGLLGMSLPMYLTIFGS